MTWCGIEGHDAVIQRFRRSLSQGRMASSFLFVGPPGIGKRLFALRLAQGLLCTAQPPEQLQPCLSCPDCQQVAADSHPDVDVVSRPAGKSVIPIDLLIGDREHRSREGLCHRVSLKPSSGRRRIAIIDDADWLNQEGANCLLKTLEEPPPKSLLILIGTSLQRQLPTIRSRCQIVRFQPLPRDFVEDFLVDQGLCERDEAGQLAELAAGSLDRAREFSDVELRQFADAVGNSWTQPVLETVGIAKEIQGFVDSAGRDAPARRLRLRQVIELIVRRLRHEIVELAGHTEDGRRLSFDHQRELDIADERLERCLIALNEINANANLATLIECWIDDLGQAFYRRSAAETRRV